MKERSGQLTRVALAIILTCFYLSQANALPVMAVPIPSTYRVAPSGDDDPECGSEEAPCKTIQYVVNEAFPGDTILVAEGVYTFDPSNNDCEAKVGAAAVMCAKDPEFTLLGGYSTSDWTSADPSTHVTIIDGQNQYRGVFLLGTGPTTDFCMEGFTIKNGLARGVHSRTGDDGFFAYGGGMFVDLGYPPISTKKIVLRNLIFKDNKAIGENHDPYGGSGVGGGLALRSVTNATLEYLAFEGNEARGGNSTQRGGYGIGGGFHTLHSDVTFSHVTLINNIARGGDSSGSGRHGSELAGGLGGGTATHGVNLTLEHVFAQGNQAIGGNAVEHAGCAVGGGLFAESATLTVTDAEVRENLAKGGNARDGGLGGGGGIDAHGANLFVKRTRVIGNGSKGGASTTGTGNSGQPGGGGLYVVRFSGNTVVRIQNSIIADNSLEFGAAGSTGVGGGGGGIWLQGAEAYFTHTTIARNRLLGSPLVGNAILLLGFDTATPATAQIKYSIIADHTDDSGLSALYVIGGNAANLERTLWTGNHKDTNADGWEKPNINDHNPIHAPSAGFISPGLPDYDYHIHGDSPARDQATGSSMAEDMDCEARPSLEGYDIGADEYTPPALVLYSSRPASGTLRLTWEAHSGVIANLDHYNLIVSCESGANPPDQGACGAPINVSLQTEYTLAGLTNGKPYTIIVEARDASGDAIATSNVVIGVPMDIMARVFLPVILDSLEE